MNCFRRDHNYKRLWQIGTIISFILYYSGLVWLYKNIRKRIFRKRRTIILTYHRINNNEIDTEITVSIDNFKRQIKYLRDHFNIIAVNEHIGELNDGENNFRDNVAITFDDGYRDNYQNAFPILKKFNVPATIFLITEPENKKQMLNKDELLLMKEYDIVFGSHTVSHPVLNEIGINQVSVELYESKKYLEKMLKCKIDLLAYPKGKKRHINEVVKEQAEAAGYKAAFTTENFAISKSTDRYELGRIGIRNCPFYVFKTRVSGIYESRLLSALRARLNLN